MSRVFLSIFLICAWATLSFAFQLKSTRMARNAPSMEYVKNIVDKLSRNRILSKTAELGLLSKLEKAGFTLTSAKPLLVLADDLDALGLLEASSDKVLPLVAKAVDLAPGLLPLAAVAVKIPSTALYAGAIASFAAAVALVNVIPDDSVSNVALQTTLAIPLGVILPGGLAVAATLLSKFLKQ